MKNRVLYPGEFPLGMCVAISGSINTVHLADAAWSLREGARLQGYSCKAYLPGMPRPYANWTISGDVKNFTFGADLNIIIAGEYLGYGNFRQGDGLIDKASLCLFFTPAANPEVSHRERMPWEEEKIKTIEDKLSTDMGLPVKLASPAFLRPAGSEKYLLESNSEVLYYLERGLPVPEYLSQKRADFFDVDGMDQIPALERPLW